MRKIIFSSLITFGSILLSSCMILMQPFSGSIDDELERAIDLGFDGIIVYVNQSGESSYYSAGWNNRENLIPADPHLLFKIASISKLYIAAATTMMVADDALSLDDTVAELLPAIAGRIDYSDEITLRMLIQHRSGIPDYTDHPDYPWDDLIKVNSDTLQYFLDRPALFKPGRRYSYSNSNYFLIGEILDDALGYSHHMYIENEILIPLGLNNTYNLLSEVDIDDVMSGYLIGYEPDIKDAEFIQPGGSMVATAEDVGIFLRALIDGTLLTDEEQAIYSSVYEYEHTGWLPGFTSIARYQSDIDAVVIQFVNTSGGELFWLDLERVYKRIIKTLEWGQR